MPGHITYVHFYFKHISCLIDNVAKYHNAKYL